ncbi:N-6 DNA methylase [Arthrobacter sp. MI7-26]|uniref:N-6 DNA methylase n=1 Tax=Arthrobacter sp. MI7-26 TaxID=2993653 RepID=UPI002249A20C|nr:N-6 DNA methylase [Arthrobacter sp. MI7-26]MCX2748983.1 N-6 DNA methylase [Arthrobacter sp. MI7-26]
MLTEIDFDPDFEPDGRIRDFLSGAILEDRPEERVRQRFLKVLHFDYGYPLNVMKREVVIMSGANPVTDDEGAPIRADIVVYRTRAAAAASDQGNIKFVVECKRPTLSDGYNQLVSYVFNTSASGAVWTNGDLDFQSYRRASQPANALEPAVGIPHSVEEWDAVGRRPKSELQKPRDVRGLMKTCNNKLHGRGMDSDDEDLTMDMVRIILAKARDEIEPGDMPNFYVTPEEYQSPAGHIVVAARVQRLFRSFADDNAGVFSTHEKINVSDRAIVDVVSVLQQWQLMTRLDEADDWDIMGAAYEEYTHGHLKKSRGQFFTNRLVVDMMVRFFDPASGTKALDPAGGSGGFMTGVLRHVRRRILAETQPGSASREHQLSNLRQHLYLVEITPRLVKIAKTAMLLNGDGHSGMTRGDSLGPYDEMDDWIKAKAGRGVPSLILTNPPFAGTGDARVSDKSVLAQYKTANRWALDGDGNFAPTGEMLDSCPPEMLFFERALDWLKPGGHLGIVMPKSFLDTATYRASREFLFKQAELLGVVTLHKNTFQPDTGVRTCILFIRKLDPKESPSSAYPIYMAISQKIGQDSEGRQIFVSDVNGNPTDTVDHDLDEILADYLHHREGNLVPSEYRFSVDRSSISEETLNVNPQFYLPDLNETLRQVERVDELEGWSVTSIGQIEPGVRVFKGPRLRTDNIIVPPACSGLKNVEPYFTPSAILQDKRDSVKWLDMGKASSRQLKAFDAVRVYKGDLLVTRSGSIGRVAYITGALDGAIVSDDAIRIRIKNTDLRAYVYAFLQVKASQDQLMINEYGAVQQHLEPAHVSDLRIPMPDDWSVVSDIITAAKSFFAAKEVLDQKQSSMRSGFESLTADLFLREAATADASSVVTGETVLG